MDRLRQIELRLTSLGGNDSIQPEAFEALLQDREQSRATQHAEAVRLAGGFALDLTAAIGAQIGARASQVADRAITKLDFALRPLEADPIEQRLEQQEKRVPALMEQFASLRQSAMALEDRLAAIGDSLDTIWKQQDAPGLGGWRLVMRAVSAQVELEKEKQPAFTDSYRARQEPAETLPSSATKIACKRCNKRSVRRIARETIIEELLRMVLIAPYRCSNCGIRSYHVR